MPQLDELDSASALVLRQRANFVSFNTIADDYTLAASDWGKWIRVNSSDDVDITVPPNASVSLPVGAAIPVVRRGTGEVTFVPGAGVTINSDGEDNVIPSQFKTVLLVQDSSDSWLLQGIGATGSSSGGGGTTQLSTPSLTMTADGETAMDFLWTNVANEDGYTVQIAEDSGFTTGLQTATPAADTVTHNFTGLTAGTLYYGRVKAEGSGSYTDSNYGTDNATTDIATEHVDFDDVTPPAIPAGYTASSNIVTAAGGTSSAPNILTTDSTAVGYFSKSAPQDSLTASISCVLNINQDTASISLFLRGTTTAPGAGEDCYFLSLYMGASVGNVTLYKLVNGSATSIVALNSSIAIGTTYIVTFNASATGTTLTGQIRRAVDSYYLNSSGTFVNSVETAISQNDSDVSVAGYSGVWLANMNGVSQGWVDDIIFT